MARLIDTYGNDVLRIAYMYLKDNQLAEDAFQEVFLKVYKTSSAFRGESSEKTWLIRITINVCHDMLRSFWWKRVITRILPDRADAGPTPEYALTRKETSQGLWAEVLGLQPSLKDVIVLYYYEEMDTQQIARVLNVPEGTVRSRLHRARAALKSKLEEVLG